MAESPAFRYLLPPAKEGWDMAKDGRRLIEDYLPIEDVSKEASREKSVRKGHISTLHLWWARRPLVACRAAVYAALVPVDAFQPKVTVHNPPQDPQETASVEDDVARIFRRMRVGEFITELCKYPGDPRKIEEAQQHILATHAAKLSAENDADVSVEDILKGDAPRPRVLDMFAGGGSIPLEALRLGCEAYALDLNPVAHIIELCTLVYPQKYGAPDPAAKGSDQGGTWAGLAAEVKHWGEWVLKRVKAEIGDLYPPIPDPDAPPQPMTGERFLPGMEPEGILKVPGGYLTPVAYLWTRTVRCKNPSCGAVVPLVRQTWLCKKESKKQSRFVALKMVAPKKAKRVRFEVVESWSEAGLGFDPAGFSKGGNATCPFCGAVADNSYVKAEGKAGRIVTQPMAVVCTRPGKKGKVYLAADDLDAALLPDEDAIRRRIAELCQRTGLTVPDEPMPKPGTLGFRVQPYGIKTWGELFTPRQMLCLLTFAAAVREGHEQMQKQGYEAERAKAVVSMLACILDKQADFNSTLCVLKADGGRGIVHTFGRQALPMIWDFAEANPFNPVIASWTSSEDEVVDNIQDLTGLTSAQVSRGSATGLPYPDALFDAVITDPPYYDNVPYADISDFFYVWLKRAISHLYPDHFAATGTPKKQEIVADASRHGGDKRKAFRAYEEMMAQALTEANRVVKPGGVLAVVYAHKTTLGWATLVEALRKAGFTITEAWPLDTETKGRLRARDSAALASSIFLVGRKRDAAADVGSYEDNVRPELEQIVRERVETLWKMRITGADLIIAAVGAGLRAFTQYARVEYANGEEVPATAFLKEVEGLVHEGLLAKIFGVAGTSIAAVDSPSRFYVLWRFTYKTAELPAGEAIVFTYGLDVELDNGLCAGAKSLVQKKKDKYHLRDFTERGNDPKLGLPADPGKPATLIDVLHRVLWLIENKPRSLPRFLDDADPDRERLRVVAQTLAGAGLKGAAEADAPAVVTTTPKEQAALGKLLHNWKNVIDAHDRPLLRTKPQP